MRFRAFKYLSPLFLYSAAWCSFTQHGWLCYLPVIYALVFVPVMELVLPLASQNLDEAEAEIARDDRLYDYLLYFFVFVQFIALYFFLVSMKEIHLSIADRMGRIYSMGLLCGVCGINIGHELGHRVKSSEKLLARLSLMSSLYIHFNIEHNKGHHKYVGTKDDPGSARLGESIYRFWPRAIAHSYRNAWRIANKERKQQPAKSFVQDEMVQIHLVQIAFLAIIFFVFGLLPMLCFLNAALIGILLLETVNYIEHYGLSRKQLAGGKYERAMPEHSWNSSHAFGRIMLFELSRHSDHHYLASRKYQVLRHYEDAPQMPTGYPGMMLLSLVPPAWFYVMHRRIKLLKNVTDSSVLQVS